MASFPPEVLEKIFVYLDGRSMVAVCRVCGLWKDVVDNIAKGHNIWYEYSKKDMSLSELRDANELWALTKLRHESEGMRNVALEWGVVYRMWVDSKSQFPTSVPLVVAECPGEYAQVVTLTGNCVIMGCSAGSLLLYSMQDEYKCVLVKRKNYVTYLQCMNIPGGALPPEERDNWSEAAHDFLLASSHSYVSLTRILPQRITRNWIKSFQNNLHTYIHYCEPGTEILAIAVSGRRIAISTSAHLIFVREVHHLLNPKDCPTTECKVTISLPHPDDFRHFVGLNFCGRELRAVEGDKNLQLWHWPDVLEPQQNASIDKISNTSEIQLSFWFLTEEIFAATQETSAFLISFNGITFNRYKPMQIFHASITAAAFKFGFLLLGTSNGRVYLYRIPSNGLKNFDFHLKNFQWKVQLTVKPVISLALSLVEEGPVIAVVQGTLVVILPAQSSHCSVDTIPFLTEK